MHRIPSFPPKAAWSRAGLASLGPQQRLNYHSLETSSTIMILQHFKKQIPGCLSEHAFQVTYMAMTVHQEYLLESSSINLVRPATLASSAPAPVCVFPLLPGCWCLLTASPFIQTLLSEMRLFMLGEWEINAKQKGAWYGAARLLQGSWRRQIQLSVISIPLSEERHLI